MAKSSSFQDPMWLRFPKSSYTNLYVYYTRIVWYDVLYGLGMYSMGGGGGGGGGWYCCWVGETRGKWGVVAQVRSHIELSMS